MRATANAAFGQVVKVPIGLKGQCMVCGFRYEILHEVTAPMENYFNGHHRGDTRTADTVAFYLICVHGCGGEEVPTVEFPTFLSVEDFFKRYPKSNPNRRRFFFRR